MTGHQEKHPRQLAAPRTRCPPSRLRRPSFVQVSHPYGPPHANLLLTPRHREVALSFDDGPTRRYTPVVLRHLARAGAHATFFVIGREARAQPDLLRAEARAGDEVANHTYDHPVLVVGRVGGLARPVAAIRREIAGTAATIQAAGVRAPRLFRPPYGVGLYDPALARVAASAGERVVGWNVSVDPFLHGSRAHGVRETLRRVRAGVIIMLHDGRWRRERDVAALPPLLRGLQARCYRVVTVSALLRDSM